MWITSGTTATATNGDTAVTLLDTSRSLVRRVTIINEGSVAGFFSVDNGANYARLPATSSVTVILQSQKPCVVKVKRIASGTDLANVWGFAA